MPSLSSKTTKTVLALTLFGGAALAGCSSAPVGVDEVRVDEGKTTTRAVGVGGGTGTSKGTGAQGPVALGATAVSSTGATTLLDGDDGKGGATAGGDDAGSGGTCDVAPTELVIVQYSVSDWTDNILAEAQGTDPTPGAKFWSQVISWAGGRDVFVGDALAIYRVSIPQPGGGTKENDQVDFTTASSPILSAIEHPLVLQNAGTPGVESSDTIGTIIPVSGDPIVTCPDGTAASDAGLCEKACPQYQITADPNTCPGCALGLHM